MVVTVSVIIKIWITIIGFSFGISELFQIQNILLNKTSEGVSIVTWWIIFLGQSQWLIYGFYIGDIPIIMTNIFCSVISFVLISIIYMYRANNKLIR